MPTAFVLINAEFGEESDLISELNGIANVSEVHQVYGVYDLVAKVEADTTEKMTETITRRIRRLQRVRSTLSLIVAEG